MAGRRSHSARRRAVPDRAPRGRAVRLGAVVAAAVAIIVGLYGVVAVATPDSTSTASEPSAPMAALELPEFDVAPTEPALEKYPPFEFAEPVKLRKFNKAELLAMEQEKNAKKPFSFRIGTFNVLASQHTRPGGPRSRVYAPASVRSPRAVGYIKNHGVDVIGLQELKPDQLNALQGGTGMAAFPGYQFGSRDTDNSILYDTGMFEFVSGSSFTIRFMNSNRPQTILRLRHKPTGREMYFLNMHSSAGGGGYAASRRASHFTVVSVVNRLKAEGLPIFLMGDMNDRAEFFCRVAPPTGLVAAIGGSTSGGCSPAGALAVDWVLGVGGVSFSGYREDRSTLRRVSDHHFISATANLAPFPG